MDPNLGHAVATPGLCARWLSQLSVKHDALMDLITHVQDLQCAWLLLLYCSAARANCYLRGVHTDLCSTFAAHHDASLRRVLCSLLGMDPSFLFWNVASLPLSLGGLGLRSASLLSRAAYWASWADSLADGATVASCCVPPDFVEPPRPESSFPFVWIALLSGFLDDVRVCATDVGRSGHRVCVATGPRPVGDHGTRSTPPWLAEGRH